MARGTTVFRIRIELIFRRCWNLITPWPARTAPQVNQRGRPCDGADRPAHDSSLIQTHIASLPRVIAGLSSVPRSTFLRTLAIHAPTNATPSPLARLDECPPREQL